MRSEGPDAVSGASLRIVRIGAGENSAMTSQTFSIRAIDPGVPAELDFVGDRMRRTLVEVDGERGGALYTPEWLRERAAFHLDASRCTGAVFVAVDAGGALVGHTIVRVETHPDGRRFGLFATTWVEPQLRRAGVADALLARGEAWMLAHALSEAATWTSATNEKLIRLYAKHGYAQSDSGPEELTGAPMVRLSRRL